MRDHGCALLLVVVAVAVLTNCLAVATTTAQCSLCRNPEDYFATDKKIEIPGMPNDTCGGLAEVAAIVGQADSEASRAIQSMALYCECSSSPNPDACQLWPKQSTGLQKITPKRQDCGGICLRLYELGSTRCAHDVPHYGIHH